MATCETDVFDSGTPDTLTFSASQGGQWLTDAGLKGDPTKLEKLAISFDNEPETLTLLAVYLKRWYAGRLNGLETIPVLYDNNPEGRPFRRILAAFEKKLAGASDLTLLYLLSLSDEPVPQQHMKIVFRSTLLERWLSRRDDYVRFLGPLGRLNEEHWHWVIENLRRLHLLEPAQEGRNDLLLVPVTVRAYFRNELKLRHHTVFQQASDDMEKLFKETVVSLYEKQPNRPPVTTYLAPEHTQQHAPLAELKEESGVITAVDKPPVLWASAELELAQEQLVALRNSLASLRRHSQTLQQHLLTLRTPDKTADYLENSPSLTSQACA